MWIQEYSCSGLEHDLLVIESIDADTEVRRLSLLAANGEDTGAGQFTISSLDP